MSEDTRSADVIEAEIDATRARLASTVDELAARAQPKEIVRRQTEAAKVKLVAAIQTPDGHWRVERLAAVGAAVVAVVGLVILRKVRS